jgi:hypothetical protein
MGLNQYSELLYYIKKLGEEDVFIKTITQGDTTEINLDKGNIFTLLHINIESGGFTNGSTILFDVLLQCMSLRDLSNEARDNKFEGNDNEIDNHNETLASLNRIWSIMYRDFEDNNITASENPTLTKRTFEGTDLYDGWDLTFQVEVPNTTLNLCQ